MKPDKTRRAARWLSAAAGVAGGAYATYVAMTWASYGRPGMPTVAEADPLLDRFMPTYDVVTRHHRNVRASAEATLRAACAMDLLDSPIVRALIRSREFILGAAPDDRRSPRGLLPQVQSMGWVVLAEIPGREIVVGAVTKPWEADVHFRSVPAAEFASFAEPGYVKIAWTLRADPVAANRSTFRTETRAVATDADARTRFRIYWSCFSPGMLLIRWAALGPLAREAARGDVTSTTRQVPMP